MTAHYEHIIWDWNGTLLDDTRFCVEIMNGMLARRRMPTLTIAQYRATFTFPVRDYYRQAGFDFENESFEQLSVEFIGAYESGRHDCELQADASDVLEHARARGKRQSILSAYSQETLVEFVASHKLAHFFEHQVGLDNIYAGSKVANGRRLIADLEHPREVVLLVGDTLHDVEVADEMGIDCVLVAHGHQSRERLARSGAPVLETLQDLLDVI